MLPVFQEGFAGRSANITCHYSSCPILSWRGPALDSLIASDRVTVGMHGELQSTLVIGSLLEEDEGAYYCGCDGEESVPSTLIIRRKPCSKITY